MSTDSTIRISTAHILEIYGLEPALLHAEMELRELSKHPDCTDHHRGLLLAACISIGAVRHQMLIAETKAKAEAAQ